MPSPDPRQPVPASDSVVQPEPGQAEIRASGDEPPALDQEDHPEHGDLRRLSNAGQHLLASTGIATLFLDRALRVLHFTPRVAEFFEVGAADRDRPLSDLTSRLGYDEVQRDAEAVLDTLVPIEREVTDGAGHRYLSRVLPYRSADGQVEGVVVTFVDLTERVRAETSLRESEVRFRALFNESQDAILLANDEGVYVDANPASSVILGYEHHELLGKTIMDVSDTDETTFRAMWGAFLQQGRMRGEYRLRTKQGDLIDVEFSAVAGVLPGQHLSTLRDITDRLRTERALHQSEERVQELSRALTLTEQRERQRIAHVLHEDLQQRLVGARMVGSFRPGEVPSAERVEALRSMLNEAVALTRTLARELSPPLPKGEEVEVLLRWLAELQREQHGLDVEVDVRGDVGIQDEALRVLLYQFLRELLLNVAKHAATKRARLIAEQAGADVCITVEDEGVGFDVGALTKPGTSGLGLPSVRERLELVGGRLRVESVPGKGTRVTITIRGPSGTASLPPAPDPSTPPERPAS